MYHTRATNEKGPKRGLSFFGGEAGIPALDMLSLATMNGAKTVRAEDMLGTIEPRKLADLVVLRDSPLEAIGNTRSIEAVYKGRQQFEPRTLLSDVP